MVSQDYFRTPPADLGRPTPPPDAASRVHVTVSISAGHAGGGAAAGGGGGGSDGLGQ